MSAVLLYVAQTMQRGATVVLLQDSGRSSYTREQRSVHQDLRQRFPKYEYYIAVDSHVDVGTDSNDATLTEEYERRASQSIVVTFLHKRDQIGE